MVDNGYGIWSAFANDEFLERLRLNHRALAVEWTIGPESVARTRHDRRLLAGHRGMRPGPWIRKAAPTARYAAFSDPDGNGWLLQKITERLPDVSEDRADQGPDQGLPGRDGWVAAARFLPRPID